MGCEEKKTSQESDLLNQLGVVGMQAIEPVILAALIQRDPLLLIGPHGVGKSYLLTRLAEALSLEQRHYNASLLSFDDLVGFPLPQSDGKLDYVQTPASIWGAQAVFLDEISRCRPEVQNKLFSIIHERRVQGMLLDGLVYRWSAMNPPADENGNDGYSGSEPLDAALADRFAFIVEIPDWKKLPPEAQEDLILKADQPIRPEAASELRKLVEAGQTLAARLQESMGESLVHYIRTVIALLVQSSIILSPRRAVLLLRNICGTHAARLLADPNADTEISVRLALTCSLPQRATGKPVSAVAVLAVHREAWKAAHVSQDSPLFAIIAEPDYVARAALAMQTPDLSKGEFSTVIEDCLTSLGPGARHAVALELFESGAAGRLVAAVAAECAGWASLVDAPDYFYFKVPTDGPLHAVRERVLDHLATFPEDDPDLPLLANLLRRLAINDRLRSESAVEQVVHDWGEAWDTLKSCGGGRFATEWRKAHPLKDPNAMSPLARARLALRISGPLPSTPGTPAQAADEAWPTPPEFAQKRLVTFRSAFRHGAGDSFTPEEVLAALDGTAWHGSRSVAEGELRSRMNACAATAPLPPAAIILRHGCPWGGHNRSNEREFMATEDVDKCPDQLTCLTVIAKSQSRVYLRDRVPSLTGLGGNLYLPLGMRLPRGWKLPESWRKK